MNYLFVSVDDAEEIAALEMDMFDNCFNEHTIENEIKEGWGYIAFDDSDKLVGYALVRNDDDVSDLIRLGVKEEYRGKGVGRQLLGMVLEVGKDVVLCVRKNNRTAIRLYLSCGFQVVSSTQDSWVMRRKTTENQG